ncbi:MAG: nitronate monooxygenase [Rhodospirillaceae bacterium]|nr:nitronate monooxygenase [Rhodospirillaceae bacterium]
MTPAEALQSLSLPMFAAPMFLVSGPDLVVEACKAGIVGAFPTPNCRTVEGLKRWMEEITGRLAEAQAEDPARRVAPWAANLVVHSTNSRLPEDLELIIQYRAPIVITALGSPKRVVTNVHSYGGLVFADVNSVSLARKAASTGVDGLVLVCAGAGGHTGDLCHFAFVEEVRRFWDGYIALAGGIATGNAVRACKILGADFAYVGTSFIATEESLADPQHRQLLTECSAQDLVVTKAFTGANANMLRPSIEAQGINPDDLIDKKAKMNFTGQKDMEAKPWKGIWSAGQGVGAIDGTLSVRDLVARFESEYAQFV